MSDALETMKLSIRLDRPVYDAIAKEAKAADRTITEVVQSVLAEHACDVGSLDPKVIDDYRLMWGLIDEAVKKAHHIVQSQGLSSDITYKAIRACEADESWIKRYEKYVRDNPFKHGNPRKGTINKELGFRIVAGLGAFAAKKPDGKPVKVPVNGSIIQSYTAIAVDGQ